MFEDAGLHLGWGLAMLANLIDPSAIVVGGDMARAGDLLLDSIHIGMRRHAGLGLLHTLVTRALGDQASVIGALLLALDRTDLVPAQGLGLVHRVRPTAATAALPLPLDGARGLLVTSMVTRLISRTSLVIRVEIVSITSYGSRAQSRSSRPPRSPAAARPGGHGPAVTLHADRPHVGQEDGGELPDVAVQPGAGELLAGDRVRLAQRLEPVVGDLADDPDPRPGPGNGCRHTISAGRPARSTSRTSSLNRVRNGSTRENSRSSGRPPTLWWDLMFDVGAAAGLDVGVERALDQELHLLAVLGLADDLDLGGLEDPDELPADDLPLLLGVADPASASRNRCASTTWRETPVAATKSRSTCSASPLPGRPWSTKTQVVMPIARCTRAAATAESARTEARRSRACRRSARGSARSAPRRC